MVEPYTRTGHRRLNAQQTHYFHHALRNSREQRTVLEIWARNREKTATIQYMLDGQVTIKGQGRSANAVIGDPVGNLMLDNDLIFLNRMLRAESWTWVPQLVDWVVVPIFTGPVIKADEAGGIISLEAQGKELWASGDLKEVHRWPKGVLVTNVIRAMMLLAGEIPQYLDIPDLPHRLPAAFQVGPNYDGGMWAGASYLAESINCDLFYDGASVCCLRRRPTQIGWLFGPATIVAQPQRSTLIGGVHGGDATAIINDVIVYGQAKPQKPPAGGGKPPKPPIIRGEAIAKEGTRFAPESLGNPGSPLYLKEVSTLEHVRLQSTAQAIARMRLRRRTQVAQQATLDTVLVPHLDNFTSYKVGDLEGYEGTFQYTEAAIPFKWSTTNPQTVGYIRRVHTPALRHRP